MCRYTVYYTVYTTLIAHRFFLLMTLKARKTRAKRIPMAAIDERAR